ncbi:hypothetical protein MPLA_440022 [Mesorhizobium sp. ORS 3359]|nr:hypothetical protein MPLA_440022 [Mesorhizobium sp. ORS 3359]
MKEAISCLNVMLHKWTAEMHPSKLASDACFMPACEGPHAIKVNAAEPGEKYYFSLSKLPASRRRT